MARPPNPHPTDAELEILKVLWEAGPCGLGRIRDGLIRRQRDVATTTIATTLSVMRRKGLVGRTDGPRGYLWSARVDRSTTAAGLLRRLLDRAFDGSAGRLVAHLIEDGSLSERDRAEIRRLLEEADREEETTGEASP